VNLKSGLIREVTFGRRGLIRVGLIQYILKGKCIFGRSEDTHYRLHASDPVAIARI
jgi:hypothetical protein